MWHNVQELGRYNGSSRVKRLPHMSVAERAIHFWRKALFASLVPSCSDWIGAQHVLSAQPWLQTCSQNYSRSFSE